MNTLVITSIFFAINICRVTAQNVADKLSIMLPTIAEINLKDIAVTPIAENFVIPLNEKQAVKVDRNLIPVLLEINITSEVLTVSNSYLMEVSNKQTVKIVHDTLPIIDLEAIEVVPIK